MTIMRLTDKNLEAMSDERAIQIVNTLEKYSVKKNSGKDGAFFAPMKIKLKDSVMSFDLDRDLPSGFDDWPDDYSTPVTGKKRDSLIGKYVDK